MKVKQKLISINEAAKQVVCTNFHDFRTPKETLSHIHFLHSLNTVRNNVIWRNPAISFNKNGNGQKWTPLILNGALFWRVVRTTLMRSKFGPNFSPFHGDFSKKLANMLLRVIHSLRIRTCMIPQIQTVHCDWPLTVSASCTNNNKKRKVFLKFFWLHKYLFVGPRF